MSAIMLHKMGWIPTSPQILQQAENRVLSGLKTPYKGQFVNVGPVVGNEDCKIWTITFNGDSNKVPLVLIHGLGNSVGSWALNLDSLASSGRPVYAIDLLGFGQSSRPNFADNAAEVEQQFVAMVERWRRQMRLNKFILLGHSLGGFISMSYTLSYPKRIVHLILADPWGFLKRPGEGDAGQVPLWIKLLAFFTRPFNPFWIVRTIGPLGPTLMGLIHWRLIHKFGPLNLMAGKDVKYGDYFYHCNAQHPAGETAFHTLSDFVWPQLPLKERISKDLHENTDVTIIYGAKSFIWRISAEEFKTMRRSPNSYTNIQILKEAGHDVFLDKKDEFHEIVLQACQMGDEKRAKK